METGSFKANIWPFGQVFLSGLLESSEFGPKKQLRNWFGLWYEVLAIRNSTVVYFFSQFESKCCLQLKGIIVNGLIRVSATALLGHAQILLRLSSAD